jgi:hypothetical protein
MMIETTWERATPQEKPFYAWLCYGSSLAYFESRKSQPDAKATSDMFGEVIAASASDDVVATGRRDYRMRLPFTEAALQRRQEYGHAVPSWWQAQVFDIVQPEKAVA